MTRTERLLLIVTGGAIALLAGCSSATKIPKGRPHYRMNAALAAPLTRQASGTRAGGCFSSLTRDNR
jgi:hypothetical protein